MTPTAPLGGSALVSGAAWLAGAPTWLLVVVVLLAAYFVLVIWAPVWVEDQHERTRARRIANDEREDRRRRESAYPPSRHDRPRRRAEGNRGR